MQHRIFLAPLLPGVAHAEAHGHWCSTHGGLMLKLDGLQGYVQNQPLPQWWPHLGYLACSETWFADRDAERSAYASDWYREAITADERRMFAREHAWSSAITGRSEVQEGSSSGLRVLAFGGAIENLKASLIEGRIEIFELARAAPGLQSRALISVRCEQEAKAHGIAARLGGISFVARPAVFIEPPA